DGYLYMTQGVFTHSKVRAPVSTGRGDVIMNAAVGRYHPTKKTFEVFADGTSNPWGVDFDRYGNAFVSACVIDHLFHMAPGGLYVRQGGQPAHRYGYELIPSIVKHRHYRAAYCGVQIYQGNQYPDEYLGRVMMGNIHANAVNQDRLIPDGSSFITEPLKNFVASTDGWFRPISEQVGPDGAVWIADWYDKYPCYQNARADPEGVDRDYGRIWRVVYVGDKKNSIIRSHPENTNLHLKPSADLVKVLAHPNVWQRRMSQRILTERKDPSIKPSLVNLLRDGPSLESRLAALWTLHGSGLLSESILDHVAIQDEFGLRMWAARLTGERRDPSVGAVSRLAGLANDPSAPVKLAVATAVRQFMSGSLTVNTPVSYNTEDLNLGDILSTLVRSSLNDQDPLIPFMIWMAAEPAIARDPSIVLDWFLQNGEDTYPLSGKIIHKTMRRVWDTGDQEKIEQAVKFLYKAIDSGDRITVATLQGILKSQEGSTWKPPVSLSSLFDKLMNSDHPEILSLGRQLGAVWGDADSIKTTLSLLNDQSSDETEREQAIRISRRLKTPEASAALMKLAGNHDQPKLQILALSTIQAIGGNGIADKLIQAWGSFAPSVKRATLDALASRPEWTQKLLESMQAGRIATGELPVTVVRRLINHRDDSIRKLAVSIIGRFQEQDAGIEKRIHSKKLMIIESSAEINMDAGRQLAETTCLVCHKLHGKGADVGSDLTGVGRSTLDALLANIINPNQIIGKGYENVEVETKDDRLISGRLIESADQYVKIASAGHKEESIPRTEIAFMRTSDLSVMPEGLEQMPDEDFRNMMWYLLNPPEDNRPMNDALRRELIGEPPTPARLDEESLALWNPGWAIRSEIFK
ncbi:MAG TPA: dehydrogenase, partial [Verrucomicrobia bacterium]|nr:dehydrogenase [Verrucomicrobiota bacterium]